MVFGFKKHQEEPKEADPLQISEFTKDVKMTKDEHWADSTGSKIFRAIGKYAPKGQVGTTHHHGRGMMGAAALAAGPGAAIAYNAMNPRTSHQKGSFSGQGQSNKVFMNNFVLAKDSVKARQDNLTILRAEYVADNLKERATGAEESNRKLLRENLPAPDRGELYSGPLAKEIRDIERKLKGGFWGASVLTGLEGKKGEFRLEVAKIENHITINSNTMKIEKGPSGASIAKSMFGMKSNDTGALYRFTPVMVLKDTAEIIKYTVKYGDKVPFEVVDNFISATQQKIDEICKYAFYETEKPNMLELSDAFLDDFYQDSTGNGIAF